MKKQWLIVLLALACPTSAFALDFSLKLEPSVAIPLSSPQSDIYKVGGGGSFKALFGLSRYLDVATVVGGIGLQGQGASDYGAAWFGGGGLRLKRPHDAESGYGISPWIEADALYVRTGPLNRLGFDVGAGLSIPLGQTRPFWIGPFVRYFQTVQGDRVDFDNRDAKILMFGLTFEVVGMIGHPTPVEPVVAPPPPECPAVKPCPECPPAPECPPPPALVCPPQAQNAPDRDGDGVPDSLDCCPDVPGPVATQGCPAYDKVVIKRDKIELKEKVFFAWDKSIIRPRSHHLLNDVVKALTENKAFHVKVEGNTDSSGSEKHNQTLSESRAAAVVKYLVAHGIAAERLDSQGYASSTPLDSNATVSGREKNRRVEFLITNREGDK